MCVSFVYKSFSGSGDDSGFKEISDINFGDYVRDETPSTTSTMKPSLRCYQSLAQRSKTTSFIGLGRMGYEMATNLFSKQYAASQDAHFVVCDVVPEASQSFRDAFAQKYPGANITIAETPQEYVQGSRIWVHSALLPRISLY